MKVLIVSYFFPPHGGGGVLRTAETARLLAGRGWDVTVVAGPEDGWWVSDESLAGKVPESVNVIRQRAAGLSALFGMLGRGGCRRESGVRGLKSLAAWLPVTDAYAGWSKAAARTALTAGFQPDWILTTSPPESVHLAGMQLAERLEARWAADFRDPWTAAIYRGCPTPLHRRWQAAKEGRVVRRADLVISTSEPAAADFRGRYPDQARDKFICLPNGFDPAEFETLDIRRSFRLPLSLIHAGNLTLDRDISALLEAIRRVNRDGLVCRLELAGQVADHVGKRVRELDLGAAVTISGYVPRPGLLAKLAAAHVGLLVEAFRPGAELVVPGKLYDYLGAGLPVLAIVPEGAASRLVDKQRFGLAATEPDPLRLENLLRQLVENVKRGRPALRPPDPVRAGQFQRPRLVERLAELMESRR